MKMGVGLVLATLGAILRYAVDDGWDGVDLGVVGLILMIVGTVAFGTSVALEFTKRQAAGPMPASPLAAPPAPPPVGTPPASPPPARPQ